MSRDGRYVAFRSQATNLLGGGTPPPSGLNAYAFLYSRETDSIRLVSHSPASVSTPLPGDSLPVAVSDDGGVVVFQNDPFLTAGQTYLYRTTTEEVTLVSHKFGSPSQASNGYSSIEAAVSTDGSYVAFASTATDLVEGTDWNGAFDVFLYSTGDGSTRLVSHALGDPSRVAVGASSLPWGSGLSVRMEELWLS